MMKKFNIWPYEECSFSIDKTTSTFKIATPWLSADFDVSSDKIPLLETAVNATAAAPTKKSLEIIRQAFQPFLGFPFFYFLPRFGLFKDEPLGKIPPTPASPDLSWDYDGTLAFAQVSDDNYDPVSLLTVLRKFHLLELHDHVGTLAVLAKIEASTDVNKNKQALALLLRQNHFVTETCESILTPAVARHPRSAEKVREFINEEKGHDKILRHAIESMDLEVQTIEVLPSVRALTDFFRQQAETDILAFAGIVDMFERSSPGHEHPLARVLRLNGYDKAAKAIQNHANINIQGEHHNEGLEIISDLGGISQAHGKNLIEKIHRATVLVLEMFHERANKVESLLK